MNFLTDSIRPIYFKYLTAAFGSSLISSIYGVVDAAMVGQYQGPAGTALLAALTWVGVVFFDRQLLTLFGAEETLLPVAAGAGCHAHHQAGGGRVCGGADALRFFMLI